MRFFVFSDKTKILVFIEFKNRPLFSNDSTIIDDITDQAVGSLIIHDYVCKCIDNADTVDLHFFAVVSSSKNEDLPYNEIIKTMMDVSGDYLNGENSIEFVSSIKEIIDYKLTSKSLLTYKYSFVGVLTSDSFNISFSRYL